jgi:hypothetical protein
MADLAVYLARSGAYLALFYALYWLALRRETFFALNRAFLLAGGALSLVLPLLRVPSPFFRTVVTTPELGAPLEPGAAVAAAPAHGPAAPGILALAYVAGASVFLLLFAARLARLALLARRCGCVRRRGLRIVLCGHPSESFSFFNFVFLDRSKVPAEDEDRVLSHELAHVRQLHSADVVFAELLTVIQWFNPFVWPYRRSLRETHEYLADRAVIAQGCGLARYQLLIVEQHVGGRLLELASSFRTSQIKRRIAMLSKPKTKGLARSKPLLILPFAVALVLAFAEPRTIVTPGSGQGPAVSAQDQKAAPQKASEEDMAKAVQEKAAQLEEAKQKNAQAVAKLQAQLKEASGDAERKKIEAALEEQRLAGLKIRVGQGTLQMKKIEMALAKETDPAKKADLEKKLAQVKAETETVRHKAQELAGSVPEAKGLAPQKGSEEEMAKALQEKAAKLDEMVRQNAGKLAEIEKKLAEVPDQATREELQKALEQEKLRGLKLGAMELGLRMKKVEFALAKETDPAKKADLQKKLDDLKLAVEESTKKAEAQAKIEKK